MTLTVPVDMLAFTGLDGERAIELGEHEAQVGASSADLPLRARVRVEGARRRLDRELAHDQRLPRAIQPPRRQPLARRTLVGQVCATLLR